MDVSQPSSLVGSTSSIPMVSIANEGEAAAELSMEGSLQEYNIATHFVKVRRSGTLADVTTLWDMIGTEAVSGSMDAILEKPGFDRLPSINAFDKVESAMRVYQCNYTPLSGP